MVVRLNSRRIVMAAYGEDFDYPHFRQEAADWFQAYLYNLRVEKDSVHIKNNCFHLCLLISTPHSR